MNPKKKTSKSPAFWEKISPRKPQRIKPETPAKGSSPKAKREERQDRKPAPQVEGRRLPRVIPPFAPMRLNRFIAACGVCARREADQLISAGHIQVNGQVVTELGVKIIPGKDLVVYKGERLQPQNFVYILLNKPKNMITTTDDPEGRSTVLEAIEAATRFRVYPVGRLDRNTTGLLLLTNDGALAEKLTHPSHGVRKVYHARLNKELAQEDLNRIQAGVELEDGRITVDGIAYIEGKPLNEVGIELHSGRNRIVRRIFEHLGYEVQALDRTLFGPLTKKRLPRGEWRLLTEREVQFLRMV